MATIVAGIVLLIPFWDVTNYVAPDRLRDVNPMAKHGLRLL